MPPLLTDRFEQALTYATRLHHAQRRKGTTVPYVAHLLAVTALVLEHGGTEEEAIAALLHDAVEDQGGATTLADIRARFGDDLAEIVLGCSDTVGATLPVDGSPPPAKPPWRQRKAAYLAHVAQASSGALLVSLADKLHNVRSILEDYRLLGDTLWGRFNAGKADQLWYYRALADEFAAAAPPRCAQLVAALDRAVGELEDLARAVSAPADHPS